MLIGLLNERSMTVFSKQVYFVVGVVELFQCVSIYIQNCTSSALIFHRSFAAPLPNSLNGLNSW